MDSDQAIGWYLVQNQEVAFGLALELQFAYRKIVDNPLQFPTSVRNQKMHLR